MIPNPAVSYINPATTGSLTYTPVPGQSGTAVITVTVTDNGSPVASFSQTFTVTVGAPNQAPVVSTSSGSAAFVEGLGPVTVDPGVGISDSNSSTLTGAMVQITGNFAAGGEDNLGFLVNGAFAATYNQNGISSTNVFNSTTGILSLTGKARLAAYKAALASVAYQDTSTNPSTPTRTVTFIVNDGTSEPQQHWLRIAHDHRHPDQRRPHARPDPESCPDPRELFPLTIDLSGISAGGGQSQTVSLTASANPAGLITFVGGAVGIPGINYSSPNTTGSLTFQPTPGTSGTALITITVTNSDPTGTGVKTFQQSFPVTIVPVNQQPTLGSLAANTTTIPENSGSQSVNLVSITDGVGDTGQTLTITAVSSNPAVIPNPTVNYASPSASGQISYAPVPNTSGTAVILVTVMDNGGTQNGGINTITQSFTVTVSPVNQAPTLSPISNLTIAENTTTTVTSTFQTSRPAPATRRNW